MAIFIFLYLCWRKEMEVCGLKEATARFEEQLRWRLNRFDDLIETGNVVLSRADKDFRAFWNSIMADTVAEVVDGEVDKEAVRRPNKANL